MTKLSGDFDLSKLSEPLVQSNLSNIPLLNRGKVRDTYAVGDQLLIITTDRISAFDCVMPNGIPDKGAVLNKLSLFWFWKLADIVPNHLITAYLDNYPSSLLDYGSQLADRSMIVKKLKILPVEAIVRGYLAGSGWKSYKKNGTVCGIALPAGLVESDRLPEPIFTPSTKAESGHDENISFERMASIIGVELAEQVKKAAIQLYQTASEYARSRGIIIADTKFEFGLDEDEKLVLADEVLTPDSSRFWGVDTYKPGQSQDSFDKQYLRDYLETLDWDKNPPAPELPDEVIWNTRQKYLDAFSMLAG